MFTAPFITAAHPLYAVGDATLPQDAQLQGPCSVTPVEITQLPVSAFLRSGARSISWSWAICWLTTSIEYLALLGRQPILDKKRTQPAPPTPQLNSQIY